jgi:tripartite motif-containing protein 71
MSDSTPAETERTRQLLAGVALVALALAGLLAVVVKREQKTTRAANPAASKDKGARPAPSPTPDVGEPLSIRETAASNEAPFSAVKAPFEAELDNRGRIWILDSENARVRIFDRDGGFLGGWGGNGDGKFSFKHPEGLAISGNNLYVADTWNHRVVHYTLAGEWKGSVTGFMAPRGVAVGPDGAVWVTDTGNNRVVKCDAALENRQTVGERGTEPGRFEGPVGIAISRSGTVYIADAGNGRIQVLDKDGRSLAPWSVPWLKTSWHARLEIDQSGVLYASNPNQSEIVSFNRSGAPDRHWDTDGSGEKFIQPMGLAIDRGQGILYVMDNASHRVLKVNLSGGKAR